MKKTKLLCTALSIFTLSASMNAFAGNRTGAFYVTLGDSYIHFDSKRHLNNTGAPLIRLGYDFNDRWAAQLGLTVINTTKSNQSGDNSVHGFIYAIDGVYRMMPHGRLEPYAFAGLGVIGLKPSGIDPINQAHAEVGIGAQYFIADSIALGADAKDLYTFSGGKNDVQLSANISFLFGGNAALDEAKAAEGVWKK